MAALLVLALSASPALPQSSTDTAAERKREAAEKHEQAQEAAEKRKREAAERSERTQTQQREAAEKRTRQDAERRDRERWERQEILRRQNAMRDADNERAADRARQNAAWETEMQRQREAARDGVRPAAPGPYGAPGPQSAPAKSAAPRAVASGDTLCSAVPFCPSAGSYGNVCIGAKRIYSGAGAAQTGLRDIVSRCQAANAPDPCNTDVRLSFGGGCAQQCANVATCVAAAAR